MLALPQHASWDLTSDWMQRCRMSFEAMRMVDLCIQGVLPGDLLEQKNRHHPDATEAGRRRLHEPAQAKGISNN